MNTESNSWLAQIPCPKTQNPPVFVRWLGSPRTLFIAGVASWPVLLAALTACAWLDTPRLAYYLTGVIVSVGFACSELSVLDCGRPFHRQHQQLFAAFFCWAVLGILSLRLSSSLF